ncbi:MULTISPECIES: TrlF family AAA-like ATPase [Mycolicibacterium]|uniref:TrlF family AAA-like ATPase n=1 Tax=Mycolicibacterium TaxID=1866885 RepID=UPI0009BD9C9B|nr:AAA family ATPase [Mycolicibacterium fortuitum]MDG5768373.1 AAA family ATPase [Mycolicibacterium fortuitum]MDG5781163.1 AAA family ATPase [Mycolicibacterium fortuitum]NOP97111.1 AAA family ATPase [Mycolicibacterium fortuitum]UHJ54100.1 AAA family ATPase [Mycolicibacterium fortuitum]
MTAAESSLTQDISPHVPVPDAPGARWWRLDIHAHSPASKDYGCAEGHDSDGDKPSFRDWVKAYVDAGIDGVVITDHNTHEGINQAREALEDLRRENPAMPNLVLFPGVELTVSGGVHVIGIFDPADNAETINSLISRCRYDGTRGASTQTANATVVDAAHEIGQLGGICVPAHADKNAGIFSRSELDLPTLMGSSITAVEIIDDEKVPTAQRHGWVALLGSDAHFLNIDGCPPDLEAKAPGTHFTWVKAEHLDLDGLKLALTDAPESIRRARAQGVDPNDTLHGFINQIAITHRGTTETFKFNPWMNCLIGGRGVGKSTVLELVRLAMGRSSDLQDTALSADLQRFLPGGDRAERWWDDTSAIEVRYTKDSRPLRVLWSGGDPTDSHVEAWNGTEWEPQAGRAADRAPIQVFSQKQVYDLARQPQSFLAILDRMPEIRKSEWDEEYAVLENQFRRAREDLRELLTENGRADRLRGELQEVQGRLRHLAQLRANPRYQELERTELQLRSTSAAEHQATDVVAQLAQQTQLLRSLAEAHTDVEGYQTRAASFAQAAVAVERVIADLEAAGLQWRQTGMQGGWQHRVEQLGSWLAQEGGHAQNLSPEQTSADRRLENELQEQLTQFENADAKLEAHRSKLSDLLSMLAAKRMELHQRRSDYVNGLSAGTDGRTRVRVFHQGGIAAVGDELRSILNRPESFDSVFDRQGIPAPLFDAQPKDPRFWQRVVPAFKKELADLIERGAESVIAQRVRIDARFHRRSSDSERFDLETNILLWYPEDLITVEYKPEGSNNFTPVDQGSPGQKTAALLAIILQMGNEPLLLDQPEDDLENKLIKHLAVETLKQIKRGRQLIISTHNANIVVTSAAEHVLVIQHGEHLPGIEASGTLQTEAVRKNVCLILEGGEDAIKTRYKRLVG